MTLHELAKACFHGGAFFDAVGDEFDDLGRAADIVNADVLDAWFPPSPKVLDALCEHLPWILRTSPPTDCGGMLRVVAEQRGVDPECLLPGAGSSALIFLAFEQWLRSDSRVLLLDPTYGEYAHVLEHVVGCEVERFPVHRHEGYAIDTEQLVAAAPEFELVVLVNPNSPTGVFADTAELASVLRDLPITTRVWIDETYVEYVGAEHSLESFAAESDHVVVCKSMSKAYALSGVRAAYLCGSPARLDMLRKLVPPWAVSLPAQIAAVHALRDPDYYAARYRETCGLRADLARELERLGIDVVPGVANFLLGHLDPVGPTAEHVVARCREHGVFLRNAGSMGRDLGAHALRVAVKDPASNARVVDATRDALR